MVRARVWALVAVVGLALVLYLPLVPLKSTDHVDSYGCVGSKPGYESIGTAVLGWGATWSTPCMNIRGTLLMPGPGESVDVLNTGSQGTIWLAFDLLPFLLAALIILWLPDSKSKVGLPSQPSA